MGDDYEIEIDEATFSMLSAIANAEDDSQTLINLTDIDPSEFRKFLAESGETEDKDGLELLRVAEQSQLSKKHVHVTQKKSYLYVGNLAFHTTSQELQELFGQAGRVESASVVEDRATGRSRGFGFVEMATQEEGKAAIEQFDGKEFKGRSLNVNEARPTEGRGGRGLKLH